ncbi:OLC1v1021796C1 [Oldenlandia corymbosa var. corymbosa]|uniref:OLC1v1021796C1 n=1 Tax=Oldenlandia corymbosa var. corymbosa TaxID=529605 RepID=A0AAV1BX27_OLDCO|nr:OLC1v1021796C1 [Oldenlandia corymbosa var. corymbosa]
MAPFEVKVSKSEVVSAVLPVHEHWLPLSNLDLLLPPVDVGVFFCYEKPTKFISGAGHHNFGSLVKVLKNALSQALVIYYAFAGEMDANMVGEPEILCNNRGVDFVEAYADVELRELNLYNPDESVEGKLVPLKKNGVLAVQATQLKCGGVVVGCTFDHRVADAYSANMFLVSWAELSQSKTLSILPSFRRSLLSPRRPGQFECSLNDMYVLISTLPPPPKNEPTTNCTILPPSTPISRIYYVEAEQVRILQLLANYGNNCPKSKRSKFESFCAFLWKLLATRTSVNSTSDTKTYSRLGIVVDGRTRIVEGDDRIQTKLAMATYFGNVLSIPFGEFTNKELIELPLSLIANEVHNFLDEALTKEHFLGLIDFVEAHRPEPLLAKIYASKVTKEEPALVVSSGLRFPVRRMDFGWGAPVFGSYHFPWASQSGYVMPMPSPSGNGDWVVYMHLSKEQIEMVENNAAHIFKPFYLY